MDNVKIDRMLRGGILLLAAGFCGLLYSTIHERIVNAGDTAPPFTIKTDSGRTVSLNDFGGKLLVLNFWATWCPPCVDEMPSLNEFSERFKDKGLVVLGVSIDKDSDAYKKFLHKIGPTFLTARDPEQNINHDYGTYQIPETYIIDRQGKVVDKMISNRDWTSSEIINRVQSLL